VTGLLGIDATMLVHDIRHLRGHIQEDIVPAQRKRASDHWLA
jgi:hypothetical protein